MGRSDNRHHVAVEDEAPEYGDVDHVTRVVSLPWC